MSASNEADEVPLLPWMTSELFQQVLERFEKTSVCLQDFQVISGTNKGENFAASIFRVNLQYQLNDDDKTISFILKATSANEAISELLADFNVYKNESIFYSRIITECSALLGSTGDNTKFAPRLVYNDDNVMVLEDLKAIGFELANRKVRFNVDQARVLLTKLAKFHAVTAVLYQQNSNLLKSFTSGTLDSSDDNPIHFFFKASFQECLETIKDIPELQALVDRYEKFGADVIEREKKILSRDGTECLLVLNHGDLWINNVFFKYDSSRKPVDVLLVDYQESYVGSPGIDLNHFLFSSCDLDVHQHHLPDLIQQYHETLVDTLTKLNFSGHKPTLQEIQNEIRKKSDESLITISTVVPVMMIENPDYADPANFISDHDDAHRIRREVYGNPKFIEILKYMLPKFADSGIF